MDDESFQGIVEKSPFIAWIHNISLNQQKYMKSKLNNIDFNHDMRYIIYIYDNPQCSQEDIVNMFCQSKGNIAKVLKKLEDEGYIKREVNPENRRKYMLTTTDKANELVPKIRQISKDWEVEVGLTDEDEMLKQRIKEIAINGRDLLNKLKEEKQ